MGDVKAETDGQALSTSDRDMQEQLLFFNLRCKVGLVWKRHATPHLLLNVILNVYQTLKRTLLAFYVRGSIW